MTGLSGSGKSWLANELAKEYSATIFQPEWLIHSKHTSIECKPILENFLNLYPEIKPFVENKWNNEKIEDKNLLLKKYINLFLQYFLDGCNPNQLYIVEGFQLFTLIDFNLIKDYPILIKGTSSFKSLKNRINRDLKRHKNEKTRYFFKILKQSQLYQFKHRKKLNSFIKQYDKNSKF